MIGEYLLMAKICRGRLTLLLRKYLWSAPDSVPSSFLISYKDIFFFCKVFITSLRPSSLRGYVGFWVTVLIKALLPVNIATSVVQCLVIVMSWVDS